MNVFNTPVPTMRMSHTLDASYTYKIEDGLSTGTHHSISTNFKSRESSKHESDVTNGKNGRPRKCTKHLHRLCDPLNHERHHMKIDPHQQNILDNMRLLTLITILLMALPSALSSRGASCYTAGYYHCHPQTECYFGCPDFNGTAASTHHPGDRDDWSQGAVDVAGQEILHMCEAKGRKLPLTLAQCAHQCACDDKGAISCRSWNGCSEHTIRNFC